MAFNKDTFMSGVGGLIGGATSDSGAPYGAALDQYNQIFKQAQDIQNPFYKTGAAEIPHYQEWLNGMSNPSGFINNLMGQYQQSPWSQYLQQQAMRANTNAASMGGLPNGMGGAGIGSTPMQLQAQQNATNISSQDMQSWLQNVLGINTQFGSGLNNLIGYGANAANSLTNLLGQMSTGMGQAAYGQQAGGQSDMSNMIGGGLSIASSFF